MKIRVLVTDTHYKHGLAAVRNLGKHGFKVYCASYKKFNPTFYSRYCYKKFVHINHEKEENEKRFINQLVSYIKANKIDIILPVGYYSNIILSKYKERINKYLTYDLFLSSYHSMKVASNKKEVYKFASKLKIPIPSTIIATKNNINEVIRKVNNFPVIIKSTEELKNKQKYVIVKKKSLLEKWLNIRTRICPQVIQEYIKGFGCGYFGIYKNGKEIAYFMHRRIREYPCSGGVSSCSKSYYNKKLHMYGKRILRKLKWTGVAMVEFKYYKGNFYLLEINPKLWGSLDLSISAGVEFPYYYVLLSMGKEVDFSGYKKVKFQWILPEDTIRIKTCKNKAKAFREWLFDLLNVHVKKDVYKLFEDPIPTIIRGVYTWAKMLK